MIWVLCVFIFLPNSVMAGSHEIEPFISEVQKYKFTDFKALNETELKKGLSYFGDKATIYEEKELRAKAEEMMQQSTTKANDQSLLAEERARASAGSAIKSSFARKTKYSNVDEEIWMKKSQLVTENPLIGLDSDFSVSAQSNDKVEVKYEPYEVEVDSIREVESDEICEEDGMEIHKCYETLNIHIDKQDNCNAGAIEYMGTPKDPAHWSTSGHFSHGSQQIKVVGNYNYPALTINVTHDPAFWGRDNLTYSKKIYFNVKDKSQISSFILSKITIKGIASVSLNGKELFKVNGVITRRDVGTERRNGGRTLSFINGIPWNAWMGVTRETSSSMDLLPYINNGSNEIIYTGIPTVYDNTSIYIEAKQACSKIVESWTNDCGGGL